MNDALNEAVNDAVNATAPGPVPGPVTFDELAALMKGRAGLSVDPREMEASPATTFEEFNLDSLGLLGIVAELENRYGRRIGGDAETRTTPHEFLGCVNAQLGTAQA